LQKQLDEMRRQMVTMQNRLAELEAARRIAPTSSSTDPVLLQGQNPPGQALRSQSDGTKSREEPTAFQFKGLTLTPGGFLEGTMLVRTRNENADIANSYSAIPLNGSSNAQLSEFRGTARNSEFSLLLQGEAGAAKLKDISKPIFSAQPRLPTTLNPIPGHPDSDNCGFSWIGLQDGRSPQVRRGPCSRRTSRALQP
jgi:hypothetical protein